MLMDAAGVVFHIGIKTGDLTGLTYLTKLMAGFRNSLPTNRNTTCHPRNVFIYLFPTRLTRETVISMKRNNTSLYI